MIDYLKGYAVHPRLAFRVWQREATLYRRIWPSTILSNLFDPVIYLLAMGLGLGAYLADGFEGVPYVQFIAPGLVASSVMMAAVFEVAWNSYIRIFVDKDYEAMMTTPAALEDVVAGELAWAATRASIYGVVMLAVLFVFGLLDSPWALLMPFVGALGGLMFAVLGLAYTTRLGHMEQLTFLFSLGITPMFLFSGVFFPLDALPPAVAVGVWASPLYHLVEVMRDLALGTVHAETLLHVLVMAAVIVAAWGIPSRVLRRRLRA